jgi:hypothetical protein
MAICPNISGALSIRVIRSLAESLSSLAAEGERCSSGFSFIVLDLTTGVGSGRLDRTPPIAGSVAQSRSAAIDESIDLTLVAVLLYNIWPLSQ